MKRSLIYCISIILVIVLLSVSAFAATITDSGMEASPYLITNEAELQQLETNVKYGKSYSGKYFRGSNDITLTQAWTPIGTASTPFCGIFDGNGKTISAMTVSGDHSALFAYIGSGAMDSYTGSDMPWSQHITDIQKVVIEAGVTAIGNYTFTRCAELGSITPSQRVNTLGDDAYSKCAGLTEGKQYSLGNEVLVSQTEIPATGHIATGPDGIDVPADTLQPDCTTSIQCNICGKVVLAALGHRVVGTGTVVVDPLTIDNTADAPFLLSGSRYTSSNKSDNSSSDLNITAQYDCTLTLNYGVSSEVYYDKLLILLNDAEQVDISGEKSGTTTLTLSAGDMVTVRYQKDSSNNIGKDEGWVELVYDKFEVETQVDIPADQAEPDCTNAVVCHYCNTVVKEALGHRVYIDSVPENPLVIDNTSAYPFSEEDGVYTSTNKNHSTTSELTITVAHPGTLKLLYGVSSEIYYDYMYILHKDRRTVFDGDSSDLTLELDVKTGDVIIIGYLKDSSNSSGSDCCWVSWEYTADPLLVPADSVQADCSTDLTCDICQALIKPAGHTEVVDKAVAATCTEAGLTEGSHCETCGEILLAQQTIPATGHAGKYSFGGASVIIPIPDSENVKNSTFWQVIGPQTLLDKITALSRISANGINWNDGNVTVVECVLFGSDPNEPNMQYTMELLESLGIHHAEADIYLEQLANDGKLESFLASSLVLAAAKNAIDPGFDTSFLGRDGFLDDAENKLRNYEAGREALTEAATAYAMFNAYAHSPYPSTADKLAMQEQIVQFENGDGLGGLVDILRQTETADFNAYLNSHEGQADLNAYLSAMRIIHAAATASTDATRELLENGFHNSGLTDQLLRIINNSAHVCASCGTRFVDCQHVPVVTEPTCTEPGYTTYTCSCGDSYTEKIAATGEHAWANATCTTPKTCSDCGETEGEAVGHTPGAAADCENAQTCTVCGDELKAALGHSYPETGTEADYESDETGHWQVCTECGVESAVVAHTYTDGKCECGAVSEELVMTKYMVGWSSQIGLIEPWFLRLNVVIADSNKTQIDYSTVTDIGYYFVRARDLNIVGAPTTEQIVKNEAAVVCGKENVFTQRIGTYDYFATDYNKGIYTYELSESIYAVFYFSVNDGVRQYSMPREFNLKQLLEQRKDDAVGFPNPYERAVYQKMYDLEDYITTYREGKEDTATKMGQLLQAGVLGAPTTDVKYKFGVSSQIVLIEPWGLQVNAAIVPPTGAGVPDHIDYDTVEDYGVVMYYDVDGVITDASMLDSVEEMLSLNGRAYVFSKTDGSAVKSKSFDGYVTARYNQGIYTYQLNNNLYVMFYVKINGCYYYDRIRAFNVYELAKERSTTFADVEECNVYAGMVDLYDAVTVYRDDYFSRNPKN